MGKNRPLTRQERIRARHLLQELSEQARTVRNAMDPLHGVHTVTRAQWDQQWLSLTRNLDNFGDELMKGSVAQTGGEDHDTPGGR